MGGTAGKASGGDAWLVRFCASTACEVQLTALHPDGLSRSGAASATAFTTSRRVSDQRRAASFTVHPDGLKRWVCIPETDREKRWPLRSWRGLAKGWTSRASGFFAELIGSKDRTAEGSITSSGASWRFGWPPNRPSAEKLRILEDLRARILAIAASRKPLKTSGRCRPRGKHGERGNRGRERVPMLDPSW